MKVLQINILGATLSTGRTTREMHDYFIKQGIESYIACPTHKDCDDVFAFSTPNKIKIDYILTKWTGKEAHFSIGPTIKLLKYINSIRPDIVHLRVLHGNCIHIGLLLSYLAKKNIATVVTMHDFWFITGMCFHYTNKKCYKWKTGCEKCPAIKTDIRQKKFDRTRFLWKSKKNGFNAIPRLAVIGVSDWVTNEIKGSFLRDSLIVRRVYNWVDLDIFLPQDVSWLRDSLNLQDKFVILGVSTSWFSGDNKGFDTYIELANYLPEKFRIILIGEILYEGILPDNICIIDQTHSTKELAEYYSLADVYLNLSKEETFGKVSAEAISCGTPVIAYGATANPEIVPNGGGLVIKTLDPKEIVRAIIQISKGDKRTYENVCRAFAEQNFSKEKNICEYISVYNDLLNIEV